MTILTVNELEKYYANKMGASTDKENGVSTDKTPSESTDEQSDEVTEKLNELIRYEGVFGSEDDYRGTLSFPNLENEGREHIAVWRSSVLGEYTLSIRVDKGELIFASEDGAIAGSIELYDDRIYLNVEHSTVPEMLLGSYMFEVK